MSTGIDLNKLAGIEFLLTEQEFDQAFIRTRITDGYKEALREVLVDGKPVKVIAEHFGLHKNALTRNAKTVRNQHLAYNYASAAAHDDLEVTIADIDFTISEDEFNDAFDRTRITDSYKAAIKEIVVDGVPLKMVATATGLHKQALARNTKAVRRQFLKNTATPEDWLTTTVSLPQHMQDAIIEVKRLEYKERLKLAASSVSDRKQ